MKTTIRIACVSAIFAVLGVNAVPTLANTPPEVSSVTASQRSDGSNIVDIEYDLEDTDNDPCAYADWDC